MGIHQLANFWKNQEDLSWFPKGDKWILKGTRGKKQGPVLNSKKAILCRLHEERKLQMDKTSNYRIKVTLLSVVAERTIPETNIQPLQAPQISLPRVFPTITFWTAGEGKQPQKGRRCPQRKTRKIHQCSHRGKTIRPHFGSLHEQPIHIGSQGTFRR
jgi:hypothetical protein